MRGYGVGEVVKYLQWDNLTRGIKYDFPPRQCPQIKVVLSPASVRITDCGVVIIIKVLYAIIIISKWLHI